MHTEQTAWSNWSLRHLTWHFMTPARHTKSFSYYYFSYFWHVAMLQKIAARSSCGAVFWGPLFGRTCWTCLNPPLETIRRRVDLQLSVTAVILAPACTVLARRVCTDGNVEYPSSLTDKYIVGDFLAKSTFSVLRACTDRSATDHQPSSYGRPM